MSVVDPEYIERTIAFANDRAEGGRALEILKTELAVVSVDQQRATNLLMLAALVDAGPERDSIIDQARALIEVQPIGEPPAEADLPDPSEAAKEQGSPESLAHNGQSDPPVGLQPSPDPDTKPEPVQPADEGGPVDDHEPMHV